MVNKKFNIYKFSYIPNIKHNNSIGAYNTKLNDIKN